MKTRKLFGTIITSALLAVGFNGFSQSISQSDLYNYIRTTWNVTSLSDSAIQQLLNQAPSDVDYDGIPYENLIGAMIETPQIVSDMNAGDFRGAGLVVLNYAQDQLFDASMEYLGVASISFPVEAASWPINASITAFANAVKQDAFNRAMSAIILRFETPAILTM